MKTNRNRYPLRTIVSAPDYYHETLECGHTINRPTDIYGTTNATKRRCRQCFKKQEETGES